MGQDKYARLLAHVLQDARYQAVRIVSFGEEVVLQGLVSDYQSKRAIEATLTAAGLRARNCLRVMPALAGASLPVTASNPSELPDAAVVVPAPESLAPTVGEVLRISPPHRYAG